MNRIQLKKSLGQNHLRDASRCRRLLEFLQPEGAPVLEIGPGGGVLTRELLERAARVRAWELDPDWAFELRRRIPDPRLTIIVGDAMRIAWERLPAGCRVAGNLPFNVGTPLIESILLDGTSVPRAGFLVQREVADRLLAGPGDPAYGSLSVIVAACARAVRLGSVPRTAFRPVPGVDAAFVGFERIEPPLPRAELRDFASTVRQAFAMRRKTLRNSLAAGWGRDRADAAIAASGLDPRVRAEALALPSFVVLHRHRPS